MVSSPRCPSLMSLSCERMTRSSSRDDIRMTIFALWRAWVVKTYKERLAADCPNSPRWQQQLEKGLSIATGSY